MQHKILGVFLSVLFLSFFFVSQVSAAFTWTETQPAGNVDDNWGVSSHEF